MANDLGSYDYTSLENNSSELDRLRKQATQAAPLERQILLRHGLKEGMSVLDLGCGPGFTSRLIAEISKTGNVLGVDLNNDLLTVAKKELEKNPLSNLQFAPANVYDLSSLEQKFDFIYSRFVFQHLEHPDKALEQILSVLNPGGIFLVLDVDDALVTLYPNHPTYDKIFSLQQNYQKEQGGDRFVGRKLAHYFSKQGFTDVNVHVETIPSSYFGLTQFVELTIGYKIVFIKQSADSKNFVSEQDVQKLMQDCQTGQYFGTVGVFNVSARKPK